MFTFVFQIQDWLRHGHWHVFMLFFAWVWGVWLTRALPALFYKPFTAHHQTTTSVIIPVVDEPEELFTAVLDRIVGQRPTEVLVVINGRRNERLERVCERFAPTVQPIWTPTPGKRNAVRIGIERASGEIAVLVDSDTLWTDGVLIELLRPFADPRIGGVTTHQRILNPDRSWLTRFADWMEDIRTTCSMPAQSVFGQVGCLPGRTIAFRTEILRRSLLKFISERFLGVHIEVSDDRALTNYTLRSGYRTVYQRTAVVYTDAPTRLHKFVRQQFRWSKGSQYNTLKMWPWMARRAPLLCLHFTADILTPFLLIAVLANTAYAVIHRVPVASTLAGLPLWEQLALGFLGAMVSIGLRQLPHFVRVPRDLLMLPAFIVTLTVLMTPIRIWGFMLAGIDSSWGTRPNGYGGTTGG